MYTSEESHPFPCEPTKVIHVSGSDFEIGSQHAAALGDSVNRGMSKFYFDFWARAINTAPPGKIEAALFKIGRLLIDPMLVRHLARRLPPLLADRARGIAAVCGRPHDEFTTAMILPDLLPILEVLAFKIKPSNFIEVLPPPRFGCSSFINRGKYFLHGRNLDFPGVAYFDRYPVIQVTKPLKGMRYIGFTTAGAPICGITGINEEQISVSLHQHYCREASLRGEPPFAIGEKILASAKSIDDATKILQSSRVSSSWAFIITDGKRREAMIYECHPKANGMTHLTPESDTLTHSNYFQSANCRPAEFATTARMNWDNFSRKARLAELVGERGAELTPEQAVRCISDHYDPFWEEEKTINRTVSQVYNVQSLVLDPEKMKVYFAEGDAPIHLGNYQEYDLSEMFAGREGRTAIRYSGYRFKDEKKKRAKNQYILSFIAAFDGDLVQAQKRLLLALEEDFLPEAAYVAGIILLKLGDEEKGRQLLTEAREHIEAKVASTGKPMFPPEYFEILLFLARAHDLMGQHDDAKAVYRLISKHPDLQDPHVRAIATRARKYTRERLSKILMPYSSYIPFE
jgi:hypothetical protein